MSKAQVAERPEPLVSVKVAAPIVGVDERTLRGWLSNDPPPFPVYRLSARAIRVRMSDVLRWLETKRGA